MTGDPARIGIVGGGILGMTLGLRLRALGHEVTILEAAPSLGGLVTGHELGGFVWDRFYHVILPQDTVLLDLLDELGLSDQLRWRHTRTGFFVDGRWHSLSTTLDYLRFPPLGLVDKVRLAATILRAAAQSEGRRLESISVADWLSRWSGRRTYRRIWLPLLKAKLGDNYRTTSAAFIWSYLHRLFRARGSAAQRESLGYVDGGYRRILGRLVERLEATGVELITGARVSRVRRDGSSVLVSRAGGDDRTFDHVVLTVPSGAVARLCPDLSVAERNRLQSVVYQGVVCLSVLAKRPLAGYYVTNITDDWVPFTTVVEMTALVDRAAFGGHSLLYLARYLTSGDPYWAKSDQEIAIEFLGALQRMEPSFSPADLVVTRMARATDVQALATLDYSTKTLPPVATSIPGIQVVNTAQIVNGTLNVNETLGLIDAKLPEVVAGIRMARPRPAALVGA